MELKKLEKLFAKDLMNNNIKRGIRFFVIVIWGGFIILLLWQIFTNKEQMLLVLRSGNYTNLLLTLFYYLLSLLFAILGWLSIVGSFHKAPNWWVNVQIYSATIAARRLPGTIWYVGGRLLIYQNLGFPKSAVLISSAIEFIIAVVTSGVLGLALFLAYGDQIPIFVIAIIFILVAVGLVISSPVFLKRIFRKWKEIIDNNVGQREWMIWIVLFGLMWVFGGLMLVHIVKIFIPDITFQERMFVIGSWAFSGMAGLFTLFLPSSFGVTDLSIVVLLSTIMPFPLAGIIAIFTRLFTAIMELLLSAVFYPSAVKLFRESMNLDPKKNKTD